MASVPQPPCSSKHATSSTVQRTDTHTHKHGQQDIFLDDVRWGAVALEAFGPLGKMKVAHGADDYEKNKEFQTSSAR